MTTVDPVADVDLIGRLHIGIVGLGLMGGSLALALRGRAGSLVAVEHRPDVRRTALREGIVDEAVEELTADAPSVDLLVLATPVRVILETLNRLPDLRPDGGNVLDLGSTKRAVVAAMAALPEPFSAIGGHPMCGKEMGGLASASADLYEGQTFILCPTPRTTPAVEAQVLALVAAVGARPTILEAGDHDLIAAAVSHLPYVVSAALMRSAADERLWPISASGFWDASRLAGADARMMLDILLTNREAILDALGRYEVELATLRRALEREDEAALTGWLAAAAAHYTAHRRIKSAERPG
jgi:prephenate dehydrogenase